MKKKMKKKSGQAMVEYIIIVVVVAIAAILIFGVFSDRLRALLGGATAELGGDQGEIDAAVGTPAVEGLQNMDETGINN